MRWKEHNDKYPTMASLPDIKEPLFSLSVYVCLSVCLFGSHTFTTIYMVMEVREGKRDEENGATP